jgi:hypothetical protein
MRDLSRFNPAVAEAMRRFGLSDPKGRVEIACATCPCKLLVPPEYAATAYYCESCEAIRQDTQPDSYD